MKILWNRSIGDNLRINGMEKFSKGTFKMEQTIITDGADCYPWMETFVIWPRRSISGKPLFWTKAYKRKVWIVWGTGFHMEPAVQYATLFDIIKHDSV